jgi:predicted signal transduction protein with EAL and GGDEF domain
VSRDISAAVRSEPPPLERFNRLLHGQITDSLGRDGQMDLDGLLRAVSEHYDRMDDERRVHRALHYQASHDALTGLINRREFDNRLAAAVESVRGDADCRHALLHLDLDQFKLINPGGRTAPMSGSSFHTLCRSRL